MRSEEFLRWYRVMEDLLEARLPAEGRRHASVVMDYLETEDAQPFRERLDLCREIRNLLSHSANPDGSAVIEPSEAVVASLKAIVEHIREPMRAEMFMTRRQDLMTARGDYYALRLMRDMEARGFSHVPVLSDERVVGVFSVSTVFSQLAREGELNISEKTRISLFSRSLRVDRHASERFQFAPAGITHAEVSALFERRPAKRKRLAAVFITDTGDEDGALLGMITPWDLLAAKPNADAAV